MTLLGLMLLASCGKEYDDAELWSEVNTLDRRVGDIESTLSRLNSDLDAIRITVTASESGLSVTSVVQTSDGWRVTYSNGSSFTLPNLEDGRTPTIQGGTWWIGSTNTGVKAAGTTGRSVFIRNNTWWVGNTDTGISIFPMDGRTPHIGPNYNWWVGDTDTGIPATGIDGITPHIGQNGNWWFGLTDTGVPAAGQDGGGSTANVPILGVDLFTDGRYYWTQTLNGVKTWLLDSRGHMMPVSGNDAQRPIIRVNVEGYWTISYDGGITYVYILDGNGQPVTFSNSSCPCTTYFTMVRYIHPYLILVLTDGTVIRIKIGGGDGGDIPDDPERPDVPDVYPPDSDLPNPYPTVEEKVVRLDMTGIQDPYTKEWLKLYGTNLPNQNVWLELEGKSKGILVINNEESEQEVAQVKNDIIFTVDNSGSMGEEANTIANDIIAWAQKLQNAGLDVQFACVGYDINGRISGAIDFCDASRLSAWLNNNGSGTNHTVGFDDSRLSTSASRYYVPYDECGAIAIRFADENMSFRAGANRIYINFTDEPNQPDGNAQYSVEWFTNQSNWSPAQGTIHTVYSGGSYTWSNLYNEDPTLMSTYTGGTIFRTDGSFSGVNLDDLTVTEAMKHSYVIYFRVPETYFDGLPHEVRITVVTPDGHVRRQRTFYITFSTL